MNSNTWAPFLIKPFRKSMDMGWLVNTPSHISLIVNDKPELISLESEPENNDIEKIISVKIIDIIKLTFFLFILSPLLVTIIPV